MLIKHTLTVALFSLGLAMHCCAASPEEDIKAAIAPLLEGMPIEKVASTTYGGLYEVITPRGIFYTDQTGSFVILGGTLVDSKTKVNLTAKRLDELGAFTFSSLPLADAIKTVRGDGSRKIATFEDPNCGFCKRLMQQMKHVDNVTIYTFLIPILSADSGEKSKAIWCSADRSKTWNSYMATNAPLPAATNCDTPMERNLALAQKLRINGTPALLFASNSKTPGYLPAAEIEAKLTTVTK